MSGGMGFNWGRFAKAEKLVLHCINEFKKKNAIFKKFDSTLTTFTSSKTLEWIDHIILPGTEERAGELASLGFQELNDSEVRAYQLPGSMLPSVIYSSSTGGPKMGVAIRVESIADFLQVNNVQAEVEGLPFSALRRACVSVENDMAFFAIERRGTRSFTPTFPDAPYLTVYFDALEKWKNSPRSIQDESKAFAEITQNAEEIISQLGRDMAAHIVCRCERDYWMSRNRAARVQKSRQDVLGLGWSNQDHHTFRSSRRHFSKLVHFFSILGFHRRERYYAGKEAGWGAQIMENPSAGLVLFLDVDLASDEIEIDFTREPLKERDALGTVGLWCALHGDSLLKGGMHHLAAQFDFDRLIEDSAEHRIEFMAPFSDFKYLRQAFSVAELWKVDPERVRKLLHDKMITSRQADKFLSDGVVGSHLENIERREGYKGFNKKNVSTIIKKTDPRK
jgi:hypothetical protein